MSGYTYIAPQLGWMEPARTAAFGAIADAYSAVGTALEHPCRIEAIYATTDQGVWISLDGVNDHMPIFAGGGEVSDRAAGGMVFPKGTIFYVKRYTAGVAPTSGQVIICVSYVK